MKIEVDNHTRWNTADLRALYRAALRQAGAKPRVRAHLTVKCRRGAPDVDGNCYYGTHSSPGRACIFVPGPGKLTSAMLLGDSLRDEVARVMHHEALHGVGARHKDMTEEQYWARQPVPWAMRLKLRWTEEKTVDRAAAHTDKLAHSRGMLRRAETRAKRAATILKKWRRRVAALERKT